MITEAKEVRRLGEEELSAYRLLQSSSCVDEYAFNRRRLLLGGSALAAGVAIVPATSILDLDSEAKAQLALIAGFFVGAIEFISAVIDAVVSILAPRRDMEAFFSLVNPNPFPIINPVIASIVTEALEGVGFEGTIADAFLACFLEAESESKFPVESLIVPAIAGLHTLGLDSLKGLQNDSVQIPDGLTQLSRWFQSQGYEIEISVEKMEELEAGA